jgi:hypothetical protein
VSISASERRTSNQAVVRMAAPVNRIRISRWQAALLSAGAAAIAIVSIVTVLGWPGSGDEQRDPPLGPVDEALVPREGVWAEIYEAYRTNPDGIAARVNGQPIHAYQLDQFRIMRDRGLPMLSPETPPPAERQYVESLIRDELLYQEAVRRKLLPLDEDVRAEVRRVQEQALQALDDPSDENHPRRALIATAEGTIFHPEHYDRNPWVFRATRRMLANSALYRELVRSDPVVQEHGLEAFAAGLREKAKVVILVELAD